MSRSRWTLIGIGENIIKAVLFITYENLFVHQVPKYFIEFSIGTSYSGHRFFKIELTDE